MASRPVSACIRWCAAIAISGPVIPASALAQGAVPPAHPAVCADGIRTYTSLDLVPTPFDTLGMPPPGTPIRVTNPDEAAAADRRMAERAGSVGATGIVITDLTLADRPGPRRVVRRVTAVFVPSDTGRAHAACAREPVGPP